MNILTSFPFTFKLAVPGISNPFSSLSTSPTTGQNPLKAPVSVPHRSEHTSRHPDIHYQPHHHHHHHHHERQSRPMFRPMKPLPASLGPIPTGSTLGRRPRPSFSPSPSPTPSTSVSLTHSYSHLAPKPSYLAAQLNQWQHQQPNFQFQGTTTRSGHHSPSPAPVSRKRGWEPSNSSPSESQATLACSNGYLDNPAKYRDMADGMEVVEVDQMDGQRELDQDDLPPTKRRRGLAGSIVSTAWSAALIGTAVGLTVYRLWRDRGRAPDDSDLSEATPTRKRRASADPDDMTISEPPSPPPPYNQEWTSIDYPNNPLSNHHNQAHYSRPTLNVPVPATPRGRDKEKANKPKPTPRSAKKTGSLRGHNTRSRKAAPFVRTVAGASSSTAHHHGHEGSAGDGHSINEFGTHNPASNGYSSASVGRASGKYLRPDQAAVAGVGEEEVDVEDQMDWIGGKLAQLIEEGKRALGTEVVVMSEAREDEVDDGSGAWVSDDDGDDDRQGSRRLRNGGSLKRRGSTASARYYNHQHQGQYQQHPGRSAAASSSSSSVNQYPQVSVTPPRQTYGLGSVPASPVRSHPVVEDACESPEVREMMERARAKLAARAFR